VLRWPLDRPLSELEQELLRRGVKWTAIPIGKRAKGAELIVVIEGDEAEIIPPKLPLPVLAELEDFVVAYRYHFFRSPEARRYFEDLARFFRVPEQVREAWVERELERTRRGWEDIYRSWKRRRKRVERTG